MENQQAVDIPFEKFTWKIEEFSKVKAKKLSSKTFKIGGHRWRILVYPKGKNVGHLSLYLKVADSLPPYGWSRFAYFRLALVNQLDSNKSIVKETQQRFNAGNSGWGSPSLIPLSDFHDHNQGFLVNDTCIIEAHVSVSKVPINNLENSAKIQDQPTTGQAAPTQVESTEQDVTLLSPRTDASEHDSACQTEVESIPQQEDQGIGHSELTPGPKQGHFVPSAPPMYPFVCNEPVEVPLTPISELIDFNNLGQEETSYIQLWEEACSLHPSLIDSQRKRSPKFILWAFTALGRVLYFLKTKKLRDMNEEACNHLQVLFDELESFGFDLVWLEPHVQSALAAKDYLERAEKVRNLKDNMVGLEIEIRKLKAKLAVVEIELEVARRELADAEKGFLEMDLDAQLGYGIP